MATTSAAVKGLPSLKVTPVCSLKVHTLPVESGAQLVASTPRRVMSLLAQTRYSQTCWTMTPPPTSYMVTGFNAVSESGQLTRTVPPVLGAGAELAVDVEELEPLLPQAASKPPMAEAENPKMEARTSNWRRVMRPVRTCSTRWSAYSLRNCSSAT